MAQNGLEATAYRGWISTNIEIDEFTRQLFSEFVIGTPSFDLSRKGRDLYTYYEFKTIADYIKLKNDLVGSIPFYPFETYEGLKNGIIADQDIGLRDKFTANLVEKIYIYTGSVSDSKFYQRYFKLHVSTKGKTMKTIQTEALDRKNIVEIEKLFYHLRNGLAHGCFSVFEQNGDTYYVIQDESSNSISARIVLKQTTLQIWMDYLRTRKETISTSSGTMVISEEEKKEAS